MDAVPGISFVDHARLLGILQSDSFLRNNQEIDAMRLKEELQVLKHRKGSGAVGSSGGGQGGRACARCRAELGRIINRGAICRACRCRVCKSCRQYCQRQPTDWLCTVCHKHMELATATGDWMNEFSHLPEKRNVQMNAAERIKHSIQRSWTFSVDASSMPSPWATLRNSPEMRAYSSMPRHHDYGGRPTYLPPPPSTAASDSPPPAAPPSSPAPRTVEDERQTTAASDSPSSAVSDLPPSAASDSPPPAAPPSSPAPGTVEDERKTNGRQQVEATDRQHTVNAGALLDKVVRPSSDQESGGDLSSVGSSPMIEKRSSAALSSPVIRKVALRRRRVDAANLPPGVTPPRSRRHLMKGAGGGEASTDEESSWLVESGTDDYRLVFISSSDSSSREDLPSDDDDCAWDYYLETGPNSGACAVITPRADLEAGLNSVITPRADLEAGPNSGACAVIAPRATETFGTASRRPTVAARGDISVIPIPVPVPVPVPVLVPVPWHPEFTIRVQHCLAPVWRELLLRHGGGSGAMTPQGADMPAGDDSQQNNTDDVVLKLYKPLEEKSVDPALPPEPSSTDSSSSDEEQTPTKRVYRFNDQTVVDGVSASSSSDYSDSSASTSSEQSTRRTKRTRRTYVVNHSNNVQCDIPGLERNYEEDDTDCASDTGVTLIKHTSVSSDTGVTLVKHTSASSDTGVTLVKHSGVDEMCNKEDAVAVDSGYRPRNVHLSDIFDSVKNDVIVKRDVVESGSTVSVNVNDVASVNGENVNEVAKRNEADSVSSARDLEPVSACQEPQSAAFECDSLSRDAVLSQPVPRQPEVSSADSLVADNIMIDSLDPPRHYHNDERSLDVQDSLDVVEKCEAVNENVRRCDSDNNENARRCDSDNNENVGRCDSDNNENVRRCDSDNEGGANVGTRSSSASDEFSGTESMELNGTDKLERIVNDNQRPETGRYTSLVMITQDRPATIVQDCESLVSDEVDTSEQVRVVLGGDTLSCLEEGLADDDSWVEELDREESAAATTTEDSSEGEDAGFADREEELRGYNRTAIDFTLHTIVEESCEESEAESEKRPTRPLERYFFYGLGDGDDAPNDADTISETSSVHSEALDSESVEPEGEDGVEDAVETACSRLEKYFLSGFMGFSRRDSDGSVGSDSEGRPSPEQRRKRLVRARGAGRSHSSSLDNLLAEAEQLPAESQVVSGEGSSDEEEESLFEKNDGQFDTVKRTKKKKRSVSSAPEVHLLEVPDVEVNEDGREEEAEKNGEVPVAELAASRGKQHSRDSGFMGSCDDLLKEPPAVVTSLVEEKDVVDKGEDDHKPSISTSSTPSAAPVREAPPNVPAESLVRKDSFNNWSSDEETNLMMSKMRAFFKTMVGNQPKAPPASPGPQPRTRSKPPQLVYFESELTRLMKTVPGLRDDQVREIVEYLSSEDTWSDSYDSSDYTSSDLEGAGRKSVLQQQISASCRQIIDNFTPTSLNSRPIIDNFTPTPTPEARPDEAAAVYQRLVASLGRLDANDSQHTSSPPLIAKVMQHIGSRLVALMHEVSSGEGGGGGSGGGQSSPRVGAARMHHRRSTTVKPGAASTTEEDEDEEDEGRRGGGGSSPPLALPLPRSKSHDPLLEASDNERFSWRGSFESALLAASDSRTRLLETTSSVQPSGKRRSASDLLAKGGSRDRLDRVRSCGSIGGSLEDKIWGAGRRSPLDSGGSADGEDDSDDDRRLQRPAAANSLPRLPTAPGTATSLYKAHSLHQFAAASGGGVKSARYRPPGYPTAASRGSQSAAASSVMAPPPRRLHDRRSRSQVGSPPPANVLASSDDGSICSEPVSGLGRAGQDEDAVDRLINQHRASLGARSDSLASVYSGAGEGRYGSVAVRGEVEFGLQYNYKQAALEIHIKQCRDLAPVDTKRNRSDPYVKVYLLPDKSKSGKRKTRVKKHTLNPVFEETLKFHITLEGLETRTLWLSVWHSDMFGRNDFLGEVTMSLENKVFDDPLPRFYTLQERSEPLDELLSSKGELIVGLKYVPPEASTGGNGKKSAAKGALHVLVKEAKNLTAVKSNGLSDPFCKSYLLPDKMRSSKQKTAVLRRTCQPTWAHTFVYPHVTLDELAERSLELTVWDHDRLASNEFLGGVRLNLGSGKHNGKAVDWMDSNGKEILLWQWMMERPNLWVESCLPLRPSLDVRHNS